MAKLSTLPSMKERLLELEEEERNLKNQLSNLEKETVNVSKLLNENIKQQMALYQEV